MVFLFEIIGVVTQGDGVRTWGSANWKINLSWLPGRLNPILRRRSLKVANDFGSDSKKQANINCSDDPRHRAWADDIMAILAIAR